MRLQVPYRVNVLQSSARHVAPGPTKFGPVPLQRYPFATNSPLKAVADALFSTHTALKQDGGMMARVERLRSAELALLPVIASGSTSSRDIVSILRAYNRAGAITPELLICSRKPLLLGIQALKPNDVAEAAAWYANDKNHLAVTGRGNAANFELLSSLAARAQSFVTLPEPLSAADVTTVSYTLSALSRSGFTFPEYYRIACKRLSLSILTAPQSLDGARTAMRCAVAVMRQLPASDPSAVPFWQALQKYGILSVQHLLGQIVPGLPNTKSAETFTIIQERFRALLRLAWAAAIADAWPSPLPLCQAVIGLANTLAKVPEFELSPADAGKLFALSIGLDAAGKRGHVGAGSEALCTALQSKVEEWAANAASRVCPSLLQVEVGKVVDAVCIRTGLPQPSREATTPEGIVVDFLWNLPTRDYDAKEWYRKAIADNATKRSPQLRMEGSLGIMLKGVVMEIDGPVHFIGTSTSDQNAQVIDAQTAFKSWLLESSGWMVVHVPFSEWPNRRVPLLQHNYVTKRLLETPLSRHMHI